MESVVYFRRKSLPSVNLKKVNINKLISLSPITKSASSLQIPPSPSSLLEKLTALANTLQTKLFINSKSSSKMVEGSSFGSVLKFHGKKYMIESKCLPSSGPRKIFLRSSNSLPILPQRKNTEDGNCMTQLNNSKGWVLRPCHIRRNQ